MPVTMSDTAKREQLAKLIAHFDTAMLVTKMSDGRLRSRPLAVAAHEGTAELLFSTAIDSPKVGELEHHPHVNVVMQEKRRFVSITGRARISGTRPELRESNLFSRQPRPTLRVKGRLRTATTSAPRTSSC